MTDPALIFITSCWSEVYHPDRWSLVPNSMMTDDWWLSDIHHVSPTDVRWMITTPHRWQQGWLITHNWWSSTYFGQVVTASVQSACDEWWLMMLSDWGSEGRLTAFSWDGNDVQWCSEAAQCWVNKRCQKFLSEAGHCSQQSLLMVRAHLWVALRRCTTALFEIWVLSCNYRGTIVSHAEQPLSWFCESSVFLAPAKMGLNDFWPKMLTD